MLLIPNTKDRYRFEGDTYAYAQYALRMQKYDMILIADKHELCFAASEHLSIPT